MLKVKAVRDLRQQQPLEAQVVVVEDRLGNPLVVVYETQPGVNFIVPVNDPTFNQVLRALGIDKLVLNSTLHPSPPQPGAQKLDLQQLCLP